MNKPHAHAYFDLFAEAIFGGKNLVMQQPAQRLAAYLTEVHKVAAEAHIRRLQEAVMLSFHSDSTEGAETVGLP